MSILSLFFSINSQLSNVVTLFSFVDFDLWISSEYPGKLENFHIQ